MTSSCASAMGIYVFSVFNNSFHIRQQGLQLPDDPRHGVGHGIQSQGVAVEQHVAQIFLTRGFDDSVLRLKRVGAKPVQKLRKHSELVQACGRVHDRVHMYEFTYVLATHLLDRWHRLRWFATPTTGGSWGQVRLTHP